MQPRISRSQSSAASQAASAWRRCSGAEIPGGRIRAEELYVGQAGMEVPETIRDDLVTHMARQVDDEAVLAKRLLCGAGLQLGQVDVARGELPENAVQASRVVGPLKADDARLVVSRGRRDTCRSNEDEPGLVLRMILDVLRHDDQAVSLRSQPRRDGRFPRGPGYAKYPGCVRRGVGRPLFGPGQRTGQIFLALSQRVRVGGHRMDVREPGTRAGHEVKVDVHHDFSLNMQVDVVNQAIDGGTDRPLDPVLNGHESDVSLMPSDGLEDGRDRGQRPQVCPGQVGLGQEGLLREGGFGAEIGHGCRRRVHSWAG